MENVFNRIESVATRAPDRIAFRHVYSTGEADELSYSDLRSAIVRKARAVRSVVPVGERVLVSDLSPLEFISAFLGVMLVGGIPVPCPPPRFKSGERRMRSVIASCEPVAYFDDGNQAATVFSELTPIRLNASDEDKAFDFPLECSVQADQLAFLQYTSGSTEDPRGVMVSHGNLHSMSAVLGRFGEDQVEPAYLCCLPLFHDMGIIGVALQALWLEGSATLLRPETFLKRPELALQCIEKYAIDFGGGPPFFFESLASLPQELLDSVNLSSWKVAFVGAEMISAKLLRQFSKRFKQTGMSSTALSPGYGLAEATLLVTGIMANERFSSVRLEDGRERVICGQPLLGGRVCVVQPDSTELAIDGAVGEIYVQGDFVALGYWGNESATFETFKATINGMEGVWLRTGDLGLMTDAGLAPVGRKKELLIARGVNYYPQDIELVALALLPNGARVASVQYESPVGEDVFAVVVELPRTVQAGFDAARLPEIAITIETELGCLPKQIVVLNNEKLPTTTSGKLQRRLLGDRLSTDALSVLHQWELGVSSDEMTVKDTRLETEAEVKAYVVGWVAHHLQTDLGKISDDKTLIDLGLDSSLMLTLMLDLEKRLGIRLADSLMIQNPNIAVFSRLVCKMSQSGGSGR
jgi:acyl-CoA synthetase (AMP-forming)/AMP-acid ligase II/acyl carrier protein